MEYFQKIFEGGFGFKINRLVPLKPITVIVSGNAFKEFKDERKIHYE
jgi:hypothetical protein